MYSYFSNIIKWISEKFYVNNMLGPIIGQPEGRLLSGPTEGRPPHLAEVVDNEIWVTQSIFLKEHLLPVYLRSDQTALNLKN